MGDKPPKLYWDGQGWFTGIPAKNRRPFPAAPPVTVAKPMSPEQRSAWLDSQIAFHVNRGGRVESRAGNQAIIVYGQRVNHLLHFLITVLTCGLWVFVWLYLALTVKERRVVLSPP
jgi:hypothetical protein